MRTRLIVFWAAAVLMATAVAAGEAALGKPGVVVSGDIRLRGEHWDDVDLNHGVDDADGFFYFRTRLRVDATLSNTLRACVEVIDGREWQSDRSPRPQQDELDLHQAYIDFHSPSGSSVVFRLGRQELTFGSQRIVGTSRWINTIPSYDAARLSYLSDAVDVHGFFGSRVVSQDDHFNEHSHGQAFFGVYSTIKAFGAHKLDVYCATLLSRRREVVGEDGARGDHERHTVGARLYGSLTERWTYDLELAHQRGRFARDTIRAWALHADMAYTLDLPWRPTIQPLVNWASGDKNPADGRHNTFNPIYSGVGHGEYGIIDFFEWMNARQIGCRLKVKPAKPLTLIAEAHRYWLDEDKDAWYTVARRPKRRDPSGRSGDSVGHELSFVARYAVNKQLTVEGGWARFFPGQFARNTGPHDNADFCYFQSLFRF